MYDVTNVVEMIKKTAKEKGLSISNILDICELNKNTLSSMGNRGSWIKADSLAKIADCLDCSVDYLLGRTNEPSINISGNNQSNINGNNNISISMLNEDEHEISMILRQLSPRKRTELMMMIYNFADESI